MAALGKDYTEWTLRGEYSNTKVQVTFDGESFVALGCLVTQWPEPGLVKVLTAASAAKAGVARELFAGLEDILVEMHLVLGGPPKDHIIFIGHFIPTCLSFFTK